MSDNAGVMSTEERLIYMADQIARNLATLGGDRAVAAVADHLASFWDPRMKAQIIAIAQQQPQRLSEMAREAVALLAQGAPAHQTRATQFNAVDEAGHSDAG